MPKAKEYPKEPVPEAPPLGWINFKGPQGGLVRDPGYVPDSEKDEGKEDGSAPAPKGAKTKELTLFKDPKKGELTPFAKAVRAVDRQPNWAMNARKPTVEERALYGMPPAAPNPNPNPNPNANPNPNPNPNPDLLLRGGGELATEEEELAALRGHCDHLV